MCYGDATARYDTPQGRGGVVDFDDGTSFAFTRLERPHLLFDDDGTTPLALFTSLTNWSSGAPTDTDKAFTFAQSIAS